MWQVPWLGRLFSLVLVLTCVTSCAEKVPPYNELGSHMLNNCLVVEVETDNQDDDSREAIANDVLRQHCWDRMIRVFFYRPGQIPGKDIPSHRVEKNSYDGQDRSY